MARKTTSEEVEVVRHLNESSPAKVTYGTVAEDLKRESLKRDISMHSEMSAIVQSRGRVNLNNCAELKEAGTEFINLCEKYEVLPTMERFCCLLGVSRIRVHQFIHEGVYQDSIDYLNYLKTIFASLLESQCLSRNLSEVFGIFVLKNSNCGFKDKVEIEAVSEPAHRAESTETLIENAKLLP